eukprot:scaffold1771_cov343-Pavlova_lutheri.AAC.8
MGEKEGLPGPSPSVSWDEPRPYASTVRCTYGKRTSAWTMSNRVAQWELVGDGRIGKALRRMAERTDASTVVYRRGQNVSERRKGPVLVCTRAEALSEVLSQTPHKRWKDLCFLQNGAIEGWLNQHELQDNTRAILYMSAIEGNHGQMKVEDGRRTVATGPWQEPLCQLLRSGGVSCRSVDRDRFQTLAAEKLLWGCIFWLISTATGGCNVGTVARHHRDDVAGLAEELYPIAARCWNHPRADTQQVVEGLCSYSLAIEDAVPSPTMAVQEWPWRNGWFWEQQPTEKHGWWLRKAALNLPELQALAGPHVFRA